jgi:hypothetical protein
MRGRRLLFTFALSTLILIGSFSTTLAQGDPPVVFEGPYHIQGAEVLFSCDGFDIVDHYDLYFSQTRLFDKSGNLVRIVEQVWGTDTLTNSETGKAYSGTFHNAVNVDPITRIGATSGIIFRIIVPGAGAIFLDVGRIVTNQSWTIMYFEAGAHQFVDGDIEALCAALE